VSQETTIDLYMSTEPWPPGMSSRKRYEDPGSWKKPGSAIACVAVRLPEVSAPSAMNGLIVEPGG